MVDVYLVSPIYKIVEIKNKTTHKFFGKLCVGDKIRIHKTLERTTKSRGNYASTFTIFVFDSDGLEVRISETNLKKYLDYFTLTVEL